MQSNEFPRRPEDGVDRLLMRVEGIKRELDQATNHLLEAAGITIAETGMTIDSNLTLTGTLNLPAGIIGNDALTTPVQYGSSGATATVFAVTMAGITTAPGVLDIPDGFTQATIYAIATVGTVNSTAATDYLYVQAVIDGSPGSGTPWRAEAGAYVTGTGSAIRTLTGLAGGTIVVEGHAHSLSADWASSASAIMSVDAIAFFAR